MSVTRNRILVALYGMTVLIVGVLLVRALFYQGVLRMNYVTDKNFPLLGIDISHHQGKIDWQALRTEELSFVYIKAAEGVEHLDSSFTVNYANSKKEGYRTGGYLYYRLCSGGREQAANFMSLVPKDAADLPPAIDLEFGSNCELDRSGPQLLGEIQECLDMLEAHYEKRPVIYVTKEFYREFMNGNFPGYPIWIRSIYKKPRIPDNRTWAMWQFANRARVNGIMKFVDLNVVNGPSFDIIDKPPAVKADHR